MIRVIRYGYIIKGSVITMEVDKVIPLVLPLLVAGLAAGASFLVFVLTKEHKTSEFRQAWIDAFREDVSSLVAYMGTTASALDLKLKLSEDIPRFRDEHHEHFVKMQALITRIRLRLNPKKHKTLYEYLARFEDGIGKEKEEIHEICEVIVSETQIILKAEWGRVKKGEPAYNRAKAVVKYSAYIAFALLALSVGWYAFRS